MSWRLVLAALVVAAVLAVGERDDASTPGTSTATGTPTGTATPEAARIVTPAEFCTGFDALAVAQETYLHSASPQSLADLKVAASTVADLAVGTALADDVRAGVDYVVTAFLSLADDATAQDLVESDDAASLRDTADADALAAYLANECGAGGLSQAK